MKTKSLEIPRPALILGVGGLLPFFATALGVWFQPEIVNPASGQTVSEFALRALGAYGAVILSFLGGVRWGKLLDDEARLRQWGPLTLSVLPSLIAWGSLLLAPPGMLLLLMAGFVAQYLLDRLAVKQYELPAWYGRLRLILSSGAVLSLVLALVGVSLG